jgi:hypothetical protein
MNCLFLPSCLDMENTSKDGDKGNSRPRQLHPSGGQRRQRILRRSGHGSVSLSMVRVSLLSQRIVNLRNL